MSSLEELKKEAQELLDFGNSHEKRQGLGMMSVIEEMEKPKRLIILADVREHLNNYLDTHITLSKLAENLNRIANERVKTDKVERILTGITNKG